MKTNQKVTAAILAALGAHAGGTYAASDTEVAASTTLEEVIVTAQRRNESIQDVPITIQALTGDTLKQLNVSTFDDLLRYTPNVTFSGNGPGTGNIFMRGLSSGGSGSQSQSTTAPFPNVALYLDDQSMQYPARNNDVYMVDMERVEVLEGPQGTLFGGGSQAGAIRYITNKPKLDVTEGNVNAGYGLTEGGDPNSNLNATFNLPLLADRMALRAVIFQDRRGGYIDVVPASISVPPVTAAESPTGTPPVRPGSPEALNAGITGTNQNPVTYTGARLSALFKINDDWNVLLQQNWQNFQADGYFQEEPFAPEGAALKPFQIAVFSPAYDKDKYASTAWTINGKFGDLGRFGELRAVYTGSYLVRHIEQQQDYSNYLRSFHGAYYACSGAGAGYSYFRSAKPTTCYPPVGNWVDRVRNTHLSHEFRISTSEDNRIRGLAGAFWEKFIIQDNMNFNYMGIPQCNAQNLAISAAGGPDCVAAPGPIPGYYASDPGLRLDTKTAFGEDVERGYKQLAFFGSIDIDLIPKVLTLTGGTRHYKYDEFEHGTEYFSASSTILNVPNGAHRAGFGINLNKSESGFKSRANLTWHITPDIMAYYTWSQGFRPGGFNRTHTSPDGSKIFLAAVARFTPGGPKQFNKPAGYDSDNLINNEVGFKSEFLNHRVQFNLSLYQMDWKNVQLPLFDPVHLGNTTFDINGPTYRVKGIELQVVARVTEGLTVQGSSSWNSSEQTNAPCLQSNVPGNPTPIGKCITQVNGLPYTNPYGVLGTRPAFSPPLQFNARARYDFHYGDYKPFASFGVNYVGAQRNEPESFPDGNLPAFNPPTTTLLKYTMPSYQTYDAAIGVSKDAWTAQLTAVNLSNNDASLNTSSGQFIKTVIPLRPRVLTFQIGYTF